MGAEEEEEEKEGRRGGRVDREGGKEWKSEGEERVLREREINTVCTCVCYVEHLYLLQNRFHPNNAHTADSPGPCMSLPLIPAMRSHTVYPSPLPRHAQILFRSVIYECCNVKSLHWVQLEAAML